jgi:hypothetical protein
VAVVGCWRDSAPVPEAPAPAKPQGPHHSDWQGEYECAQGPTAVRLGLDVARTGDARATFEFSALANNPGVPHGLYRMRGKLRMIGGGSFELALVPDEWIERPPGYVMVGLTVVSDRERRGLIGHIDNPQCGNITLSRPTAKASP